MIVGRTREKGTLDLEPFHDVGVAFEHEAPDVLGDVRGEATVKRFYREKAGMIRLQPASEGLAPILARAGDVEIRGVVTAVMRKYAPQRRRSAA